MLFNGLRIDLFWLCDAPPAFQSFGDFFLALPVLLELVEETHGVSVIAKKEFPVALDDVVEVFYDEARLRVEDIDVSMGIRLTKLDACQHLDFVLHFVELIIVYTLRRHEEVSDGLSPLDAAFWELMQVCEDGFKGGKVDKILVLIVVFGLVADFYDALLDEGQFLLGDVLVFGLALEEGVG